VFYHFATGIGLLLKVFSTFSVSQCQQRQHDEASVLPLSGVLAYCYSD